MSDLELKIKRITIAAEARGIKINEQRLRRKLRRLNAKGKDSYHVYEAAQSLRAHRINQVRHEARAMHLACNFLRERAYCEVEPISYMWRCTATFESRWAKLWERVRYHVDRHLPAKEKNKGLDEFGKWEEDAKRYASAPDMHQPALEAARAGSLRAKAERRSARAPGHTDLMVTPESIPDLSPDHVG